MGAFRLPLGRHALLVLVCVLACCATTQGLQTPSEPHSVTTAKVSIDNREPGLNAGPGEPGSDTLVFAFTMLGSSDRHPDRHPDRTKQLSSVCC
jgi:hypothetical protein